MNNFVVRLIYKFSQMFEVFAKAVVLITEFLEKISRRIVLGQSFGFEKVTSDGNHFLTTYKTNSNHIL